VICYLKNLRYIILQAEIIVAFRGRHRRMNIEGKDFIDLKGTDCSIQPCRMYPRNIWLGPDHLRMRLDKGMAEKVLDFLSHALKGEQVELQPFSAGGNDLTGNTCIGCTTEGVFPLYLGPTLCFDKRERQPMLLDRGMTETLVPHLKAFLQAG